MKKSMKATSLRAFLITLIVLIMAGVGGGFYYVLTQMIKPYAVEVNHKLIDAKASSSTTIDVKALQQQISQQEAIQAKIASLYAPASDYQTAAIRDLSTYCQKAGLPDPKFTFGTATAGPGAPSTSATANSPSKAATTSGPTNTVTITLPATVNYQKFLTLIGLIQQNAPKMQVSGIDLARSNGTTDISTGSLTVGIYTQ